MKTFIVDAFTDKPFAGNPAGVCLVEEPMDEQRMLCIAQELGLSETAFVRPLEHDGWYSIRYFSPVMEIPLCGHATLASARVLFDVYDLAQVTFVNINQVELPARSNEQEIVLEFPIYDTQPAKAPSALLSALTLDTVENVVYNKETRILLLEIVGTEKLASLAPDFTALVNSHDAINGVLVTAAADEADNWDFHSRYFWPWSGTNEDPVTGGTHTFLAKYWSKRLGKTKLQSFQASKRTGFMQVELVADKLFITSQAYIVFRGALEI